MIANADPGRVFYLSVALKDGSMEAFDEVEAAVGHATDLVKGDDTERTIFVAVPRARVRMAVRIDPITSPPSLPTPEQSEPMAAGDWEKSQSIHQ